MSISMLSSVLADHRGWGSGPGPWFLFFPLFWLAVLALGVWWFRRRGGAPWRREPSARSVLAERYARGDISVDEYRERLAVLKENDR
jgi:putative membrane protein